MNPLKSGQSVKNQWQTVNDVHRNGQFRGHENIDMRGRQEATSRSRHIDYGKDVFPFQIYSFPTVWRATSAPTTDWLKFRIHGGIYNGVVVTGTDGTDTAAPGASNYVPGGPDAQVMFSESGGDFTGTEYTLPTGQSQVYFWIDASSPTPAVKWGYTGSTTSGLGGTPSSQGWTAFPTPDAQHIPIGWVDTNTDAATYWAHVRQLLRQDNPASGGGATVGQYTFVSDGGTYWACTDASGNNVNLAKPYKLRTSIASETIAGVVYSYAYAVVNGLYQCTTTYSGLTEVDQIVPPMLVGDLIYGMADASLSTAVAPLAVASATVASGGTGYVSGDVGKVLTVVGGTYSSQATITISTVAGGAVTGITVSVGGAYTANPTLTGNAATGSTTGSGATFNLTMSAPVLDLNVDGRAWSEI